jgi:predicted outer membrane repeat protein
MQTPPPSANVTVLAARLTAIAATLLGLFGCGAVDDSNLEELEARSTGASVEALTGVTTGVSVGGSFEPEPQFACGAWVTHGRDSGAGSLRQALANPPSWGSICFAESMFEHTPHRAVISLSSPIVVASNVHIAGPGSGELMVIGGRANGAFAVRGGVRATFYGFNVASCGNTAITNYGNLTLERMRMEDNHADGSGGAIYNSGTLRIVRSTLEDNTSDFNGGAIYAYYGSDITIERSTFEYNTASNSGGAIAKVDGNLTISRSTFDSNRANFGGAIYQRSKKLTLSDSSFEANEALDGGAIYQYGYGVTGTELNDTNMLSNWSDRSGGAIYSTTDAGVKLVGTSTVAYNGAGQSAGGIWGGIRVNAVAGVNVYSNAPSNF